MPYVESSVRREQFVAAARAALTAHGVAKTSLRLVAAEAGVPLATMQYVFPSKEQLLRAVIDDLGDEVAQVLAAAAATNRGLEHGIRQGLRNYWSELVAGGRESQVLQYELFLHVLRAPGHEDLAKLQYQRYTEVVARWCRQAADQAGETAAVPFDMLASLIVAGVDGLIIQHLSDPDDNRSRKRLDRFADMVVGLAAPQYTSGARKRRA